MSLLTQHRKAEPLRSPSSDLTFPETLRSFWRRGVLKARRSTWRALAHHRFANLGTRSFIDGPSHVSGHRAIAIGDRVAIWRYARIDALRSREGAVRLTIGDDTVIQPYVHIGAAERVEIGCQCLFASGIYITDHDHDYLDPDDPPVFNGRLICSPTVIEDRVWLGERVIVLKGVTIGRSSIIGAGSVVTKSIPPFSIAAGSPARVLRQWDADQREWVRV